MKKIKVFSAFLLIICLALSFSVSAVAETADLNSGLSVDGQFNNNVLKVSITNNTGKDILKIGYVRTLDYYDSEIPGCYLPSFYPVAIGNELFIANGQTAILESNVVVPSTYVDESNNVVQYDKNHITLRFYVNYIEFTDGTTWGNFYASQNDVYSNYTCLTLPYTVTSTITPSQDSQEISSIKASDFVGSLILAAFFIVIIVIVAKLVKKYREKVRQRKIELYESTDYFKDTGIGYDQLHADKGFFGEYLTRENLNHIPGYKKFISNCYLTKTDGKTTEIDLIMLHTSGIYVFESKNYGGRIYADENSQKWMQILPGDTRNQFFNPIIQNNTHIIAIRQLLNDYKMPIHSVIVFSERCTFAKMDVKSATVVYRDDLLNKMKNLVVQNPNSLTDVQIDEIYNKLYPYTKVSDEIKQKHIEEVLAKKK